MNVHVDDKSIKVGGHQRIISPDGFYQLPLDIKNGLPRLPMQPFTDDEWDTLPHFFLTSETIWDPKSIDHEVDLSSDWQGPQQALTPFGKSF